MIIGVPKEITPGERRVALVPDAVRAIAGDDVQVFVEAGSGLAAGFDDAAYEKVGATVETDTGVPFGTFGTVIQQDFTGLNLNCRFRHPRRYRCPARSRNHRYKGRH